MKSVKLSNKMIKKKSTWECKRTL